MQQLIIPMSTNSINTSLQIGDIIYYSRQSDVIDSANNNFDTGFNQTTSLVYRLGTLIDIDTANSNIKVIYDDTILGVTGGPALPTIGDFLMFQKDTRVNTSSVLGYYMKANFINSSRAKIELFSVGSEVSESSK